MDTYIIRIFRRSGENPEEIAGTSEHVETGEKQVFRDMKKLSGIIAGTETETGHPAGHHKTIDSQSVAGVTPDERIVS